ncbi:DUF6233 domain-containing protein [Streptomyces sp. NPDC007856]|uniref:DUF6233 domain-containing protein n=1 Tax=Streptomyces sp. NPDC007856 TaxID=3364781 RepID=UPI00368D50A3
MHVGDCWAAKKSGRCRPVSREQAVAALRQHVPACPHCRPDTELGVLDQAVRGRRHAARDVRKPRAGGPMEVWLPR